MLIHGTPPKNDTAENNARLYAESWEPFVEEHGLVLLVPVFNQEDFSCRLGDHAMSGYRGLFGRDIGADEWVLRLVGAHQNEYGSASVQLYIYGHSAGGQFTARFLVAHPGSVKGAVISSAAQDKFPRICFPARKGETGFHSPGT